MKNLFKKISETEKKFVVIFILSQTFRNLIPNGNAFIDFENILVIFDQIDNIGQCGGNPTASLVEELTESFRGIGQCIRRGTVLNSEILRIRRKYFLYCNIRMHCIIMKVNVVYQLDTCNHVGVAECTANGLHPDRTECNAAEFPTETFRKIF